MKRLFLLTIAVLGVWQALAQETTQVSVNVLEVPADGSFPYRGNWFVDAGFGYNTTFVRNPLRFSRGGGAVDVGFGKWVAPDFAFRFGFHGFKNRPVEGDRTWYTGSGSFNQLMGVADLMWNPLVSVTGVREDRVYSPVLYARGAVIALAGGSGGKSCNYELGAGLGLRNEFRLSDICGLYLDLSAMITKAKAFRQTGRFLALPSASVGVYFNLWRRDYRVRKLVHEITRIVPVACEHKTVINRLSRENEELRHKVEDSVGIDDGKPTYAVKMPQGDSRITVFFEVGKSELSDLEKERLRSFFDGKDLGGSTVYLCGYADRATGGMDTDWMLGSKRASKVATFIMEDIRPGVNGLVSSVGGGTDRFGSRDLNRCVEIKIEWVGN